MSTSGQSGRTMVLGDINHDSGQGSEFHSYEFNPPTPLPDPDDICVLPDDFLTNGAIPAYPTASPTPPPSGCLEIPQKDLPNGLWEEPKNSCKQCEPTHPGGPVSWWPCDQNPPLCKGNCKFANASKPTRKPTNSPPSGCSEIPQKNLPNGSWEEPEGTCRKCEPNYPGGPVSWWPCDQNPRLCEGNCQFAN